MIQDLVRELTTNPQSLQALQQLLARSGPSAASVASSTSVHSSTIPSTNSPSNRSAPSATKAHDINRALEVASRVTSSTSNPSAKQCQEELAALRVKVATLEERNSALMKQSLEWKAKLGQLEGQLHQARQRATAALVHATDVPRWLDAPFLNVLPQQKDEGSEEHGVKHEEEIGPPPPHSMEAKQRQARWRSGSELELPESRRGRRLDSAPSHAVAGSIVKERPSDVMSYRSTTKNPPMPAPTPVALSEVLPSAQGSWRRGPRTPSQTEADKVSKGNSNSQSRSIALGATPAAVPPPAPRAQLHTNTVQRRWEAPPRQMPSRFDRLATVAHDSPAPLPPAGRSAGYPHTLEQPRSGAPPRAGLGGSEAGSRCASSAASSVGGTLRSVHQQRAHHHGAATRSPSPVDPKRGPEQDRRFITSGLDEKDRETVTRAVQQIRHRASMVEADSSDSLPDVVTHVVLRGTPRSVKALCALVSGKWIVSPEYVRNSLAEGCWLDEYEQGGLRILPPPLSHHRFLVAMEAGELRDLVAKVIRYGGGEVLPSTVGHAKGDGVVIVDSAQQLLDFCMRGTMSA